MAAEDEPLPVDQPSFDELVPPMVGVCPAYKHECKCPVGSKVHNLCQQVADNQR